MKAFGLLGLSMVLGTFASETLHHWIDPSYSHTVYSESAKEPKNSSLQQTVKLDKRLEQ